MSPEGRLDKTYRQLVKSYWNFLEHFAINVRNVYLKIHIDFNIEHVF